MHSLPSLVLTIVAAVFHTIIISGSW